MPVPQLPPAAEKLVWEASKGKPWDVSVINPTVVYVEDPFSASVLFATNFDGLAR